MITMEALILKEWDQFSAVQNEGGRASCQKDKRGFVINRAAQLETWNQEMRDSWAQDIDEANAKHWNLFTEKYARMMRYTAPEEYVKLADQLPAVSAHKEELVNAITAIQMQWQQDFMTAYPKVSRGSRPKDSTSDGAYITSFETYFRCELETYSERTLELFLQHVNSLLAAGQNMTIQNLENVARMSGFKNLDEMEARS